MWFHSFHFCRVTLSTHSFLFNYYNFLNNLIMFNLSELHHLTSLLLKSDLKFMNSTSYALNVLFKVFLLAQTYTCRSRTWTPWPLPNISGLHGMTHTDGERYNYKSHCCHQNTLPCVSGNKLAIWRSEVRIPLFKSELSLKYLSFRAHWLLYF